MSRESVVLQIFEKGRNSMNAAHKIVVLVGSIFLAVGVFVGIIFAIVAEPGKFPLAMLSLPGSFLLIGGGMDIVVAILVHNKKMIVKKERSILQRYMDTQRILLLR